MKRGRFDGPVADPAPSLDDQFLTVEQAAEVANCSRKTISRWIASGLLPASRNGRVVRVPKQAVLRVLTPWAFAASVSTADSAETSSPSGMVATTVTADSAGAKAAQATRTASSLRRKRRSS